jgi:hypothetical protein
LEALNILKTEGVSNTPTTSKPPPLLYQPRFIWTGIIIAILSVAAMGFWHLMGEPGMKKAILKKPEKIQMKLPSSGSAEQATQETAIPKTHKPFILGKDGITLHLITGGELKKGYKDPKNERQPIRISPFYMDEEMVTNHHFADFLNEMKNRLVVENGIVKNNNEIWFYLGEGVESDQQIIFKHDRFHLRNAEYAAYPVTRVTWYGALAYARHYGKRLLTESEWEFVASKHIIQGQQPMGENTNSPQIANEKMSTASQSHIHMIDMGGSLTDGKQHSKTPTPKDPGETFKEWVIRNDTRQKSIYEDESKENIFYPSLTVAASQYPGQQFKNFRYPWEAFSNVGFRCAISLDN